MIDYNLKKSLLISLKRFIHALIFNSCIFIILIIGIQNSHKKNKVNFIMTETVELPNSFIIGISFITGSIFGYLYPIRFLNKKEN